MSQGARTQFLGGGPRQQISFKMNEPKKILNKPPTHSTMTRTRPSMSVVVVVIATIMLFLTWKESEAFSISSSSTALLLTKAQKRGPTVALRAAGGGTAGGEENVSSVALGDRRRLFRSTTTAAAAAAAVMLNPKVCQADDLPSITVKEFESILRQSARSVRLVEFSGPKSETAIAQLVDGTQFSILGLVESSSDPRSPLKLAATCRMNNVPTKFKNFELAVTKTSTGGKKQKVYANSRVREAALREKAKRERLRQDEADRLAALYAMEMQDENQQQLQQGGDKQTSLSTQPEQ